MSFSTEPSRHCAADPTGVALLLASASPRRRLLLEEAGYEVVVHPADLDDAELKRGCVTPEEWVMALAYFKARRVQAMLSRVDRPASADAPVILGADTVCVHGDEIFGQPMDEADARRMIVAMREVAHRTMTGVCLLPPREGCRLIVFDVATVIVGDLPDDTVEAYLASGGWRGKAGGYNLIERQQAGWPISCEGDPATVMGLPMRRLAHWLARFAELES